ncbi:hypothetical protein ACEPAG_2816 [Sanghuangporus baumii]
MLGTGYLRVALLFFAFTLASAQVKIVHTNDDGWAVANIRAQNTALVTAGFNVRLYVVLSAPADNESGTGSSDAEPEPLGSDGCQFESCPPFAPAAGSDPDNARFNYDSSFPVTAIRFGIQTAASPFFDDTGPDLVVSGPNVGNKRGTGVLNSGTVGAAIEAAKEGFPSIAFSGSGGAIVSFTTLSQPSSSTTTANVFASIGLKFVQALLAQQVSVSSPILPKNVSPNVNYPAATGACINPDAFSFVLTRINTASSNTPTDVDTCGTNRLPTESSTVAQNGCFVSLSVTNATTKGDVDSATQAFVLDRLGDFLTCA